MGQQAKFSIEKRVKVGKRWKFCRLAVAGNNRLKADTVLVGDVEEVHREGYNVLRLVTRRIRAGTTLAEALQAQKANIGARMVAEATGQPATEPATGGKTLKQSTAEYLTEISFQVACKDRRPKAYSAARLALDEFLASIDAGRCPKSVSYLQIKAHIARDAGSRSD